MLQIYICEDDGHERQSIEAIVLNVIMIDAMDARLSLSTANPNEIISLLQTQNTTGLYLLDLTLNHEISGIQLASRVREMDPRGYIVIITAHRDELENVIKYKVEPLDFICKKSFDNLRDRIEEAIRTAYNRHVSQVPIPHGVLRIKQEGSVNTILYEDIISIETIPGKNTRRLILITPTSRTTWPETLNCVEKRLDERFLRISQSFIVNSTYIQSYSNSTRELTMSNGSTFTVSMAKVKLIKKLLL